MANITFLTSDGITIHGLEQVTGDAKSWVVLLHMMPAAKESYGDFQNDLASQGVSSLAIDFRGHGESTVGPNGQKMDYKQFTDEEHQSKIRDIEAALAYLSTEHGTPPTRVVLVGASIGANLALQYAAAHADIPGVVLLSPGLNYREIVTMSFIQSMTRDRHVFLVASEDDPESSAAVDKLAERSLAKTDVRLFQTAGHGTNILGREAVFRKELVRWIMSRLQA